VPEIFLEPIGKRRRVSQFPGLCSRCTEPIGQPDRAWRLPATFGIKDTPDQFDGNAAMIKRECPFIAHGPSLAGAFGEQDGPVPASEALLPGVDQGGPVGRLLRWMIGFEVEPMAVGQVADQKPRGYALKLRRTGLCPGICYAERDQMVYGSLAGIVAGRGDLVGIDVLTDQAGGCCCRVDRMGFIKHGLSCRGVMAEPAGGAQSSSTERLWQSGESQCRFDQERSRTAHGVEQSGARGGQLRPARTPENACGQIFAQGCKATLLTIAPAMQGAFR
jgi:hypothetical protein